MAIIVPQRDLQFRRKRRDLSEQNHRQRHGRRGHWPDAHRNEGRLAVRRLEHQQGRGVRACLAGNGHHQRNALRHLQKDADGHVHRLQRQHKDDPHGQRNDL